jgi:outer membrane protein W
MKVKSLVLYAAIASALSAPAFAEDSMKWFEPGKWYVRIGAGASVQNDQNIDQTGLAASGIDGKMNIDSGYTAGISLGYMIDKHWSTEVAWDYISNDADLKLSNGNQLKNGDLASTILFFNGRYTFDEIAQTKLRPYLGAGLGLVTEIDADVRLAGKSLEFNERNKLAYQLMAGATYPINEKIDFDAGVRYLRVDSVDLEQTGGSGKIKNLDYDPWLFTVGVTYKF